MQIGHILQLLKDVIVELEASGALKSDGTFDLTNVAADVNLAQRIEVLIKAKGVIVPPRIDQLLASLPFIISFFK